jgi:hypothetical protein
MRGNNNRLLIALLALTLVLAVASTSQAAVIFEGGGWRISTLDANVANRVTIVQDEGNDGTLVLEIFKDFLQPINSTDSTLFINILFEQIDPAALTASKIVINDESIYNGTGKTWTSFNWFICSTDHYCPAFNMNETYPAGQAGFSTTPFTNHYWVSTFQPQALLTAGGTLASGDSFNPGYTGALVIDTYGASMFILTEKAGTPEPVTMSLLAIGGLCIALRRRP